MDWNVQKNVLGKLHKQLGSSAASLAADLQLGEEIAKHFAAHDVGEISESDLIEKIASIPTVSMPVVSPPTHWIQVWIQAWRDGTISSHELQDMVKDLKD